MNRLLLIDAYAMIYRAYYAFLKVPRQTSTGMNTSAIYGFVITLQELLSKVNPTHLAVAFDPKGKTFRHEAYERYKAQRQETPEDIRAAVPWIKQILEAMDISILEVEGFEADDVIGTVARQAQQQGFEVLMATPDKDYGQLVDEHIYMYRPRHNGGFEQMGVAEVCAKYGIDNQHQIIDLLGLMGDSSDNIPGCTGVGEKRAVALLHEFGSIDNLLANTDKLKGALKANIESQRDQILFSRFLATIRTDVPIEWTSEQLRRREPQVDALVAIYRQLEFRSLLRNLAPEQATPTAPARPDLFNSATATDDTAAASPAHDLEALSYHFIQALPPKPDAFAFALMPTESGTADSAATSSDGTLDLFAQMQQADGDAKVAITTDGNTVCVCPIAEIKAWLEDSSIRKYGHDLKSAYKTLHQHDIRLSGPLCDIAVVHYLLQPELSHELRDLCESYLHLSCTDSAEDAAIVSYRLASQLSVMLAENIGAEAADKLLDMEMRLIPVLAKMEMAGVRFNSKVLRETSESLRTQANALEVEIKQLAGSDFNLNSPKQTGEILFDRLGLDPKAKRTKSGQYVTSEEVLLTLRDRHPIIDKILDYRELKKLLSTYIDALPTLINPATGKIHTTYNQTVTATGRLSSSNPNLQNLPIRSERGKDIRRAVISDPGCLLLSADYSQIELRLMAHLSGDEHMIAAFRQGHDIHAATAAKIFGCDITEVSKDMRRKAKTANFGIIYGISAFGLAQQLGSSRTEAKQLIDDYFASFPAVVEYIERCKQLARERGYTETMFGRRRYLPDINSRNATVRAFAERNAVNAPIQGTAADIIKLAMVGIDSRLTERQLHAKMIMQVHDELNFNVPETEVDLVREIVVSEMQNVVQLRVPLIAECGVGKNWLEAH